MRGLLLTLLLGAASARHASTSAELERILDSIEHDVKALAGDGELALDPITGKLERADWVEIVEIGFGKPVYKQRKLMKVRRRPCPYSTRP